MSELDEISEAAQEISWAAAGYLREAAKLPMRVELKEGKAYTDYVSHCDLAADQLICSQISEWFPTHSILSEEGGRSDKAGAPYEWVVDPIDGTSNFIRGLAGWAVSVGARDQSGEMVCAVVADPVLGEVFSARADEWGVRLNGVTHPGLDPAQRVSTLRDGVINYVIARDLRPGAPRKCQVQRAIQLFGQRAGGSVALALAHTAVGRYDVTYYELAMEPWDYEPGLLLCERAGLRSELLPPDPLGLRHRVIAGPPELCEELLQAIEQQAPEARQQLAGNH